MAAGTHTFTSVPAGATWTPSTGNVYPVRTRRRKVQAVGESAGGQRYVQDKGIKVVVHELTWTNMTNADLVLLEAFLDHVNVVWGATQFTWNDLNNVNHTVWLEGSNLDDIEETQARHNVVIMLREEL